jgi:hypothetical protein
MMRGLAHYSILSVLICSLIAVLILASLLVVPTVRYGGLANAVASGGWGIVLPFAILGMIYFSIFYVGGWWWNILFRGGVALYERKGRIIYTNSAVFSLPRDAISSVSVGSDPSFEPSQRVVFSLRGGGKKTLSVFMCKEDAEKVRTALLQGQERQS